MPPKIIPVDVPVPPIIPVVEEVKRTTFDIRVFGFGFGIGPFLGYHHILMILIAVGIILLSFLLAGTSSSSPGIVDIFLISLYYQMEPPIVDTSQVDPGVSNAIANIVGNAMTEVRVGYFGICVSANQGGGWLCSDNATALANQVTVAQDPYNLIFVASTFKDNVVFPYLIIIGIIFAFITFLLLATFPGWHEELNDEGSIQDVKPFPSRAVSQISLALLFIAMVFILVSVLWQHTASVAASTVAQDFGDGSVQSGVGAGSLVLGWIAFVLFMLVTMALLAMILSMKFLNAETGGDGGE